MVVTQFKPRSGVTITSSDKRVAVTPLTRLACFRLPPWALRPRLFKLRRYRGSGVPADLTQDAVLRLTFTAQNVYKAQGAAPGCYRDLGSLMRWAVRPSMRRAAGTSEAPTARSISGWGSAPGTTFSIDISAEGAPQFDSRTGKKSAIGAEPRELRLILSLFRPVHRVLPSSSSSHSPIAPR